MKISRTELYIQVWSMPLTKLAQKFNISNYALERLCRNAEIPLPKAGHWMKLKFGKESKQPPLPALPEQTDTANTPDIIIGSLTPLQLRQKEVLTHLKENLIIPRKLSKPVDLVASALKAFREKDNIMWRSDGMVSNARHGLDIKVSIKNISRTCKFWDTFIKCLELRGHKIFAGGSRTYVKIMDEDLTLIFREITVRERIVKDNWVDTRYKPTGVLSLKLESYRDKEWKDGKLLIENRLSEIIAHLELIGEERASNTLKRKIQKEKDEEILRLKKELEKRKNEELLNFKELLNQSIRWRKAADLREYLDKMEALAKLNNKVTDKFEQWLKWARDKADWYDPFVEREDELLKLFNIKLFENET